MNQSEIESHTHTVDGVNYRINIEPCGKGWIGKWTCGACSAIGGSSSLFRSKEETLGHAKINLSAHHGMTHHPNTASP